MRSGSLAARACASCAKTVRGEWPASALHYCAAYQDDVDRELALRRSEAAEERARYDVERSLLG
jgi:hypothetical protein